MKILKFIIAVLSIIVLVYTPKLYLMYTSVHGCMDPTAFNYNPDANRRGAPIPNTGSECIPVVEGCTKDVSAFNYNPDANTEVECIPVIEGCMDATAFNYDPNANTEAECIPHSTTSCNCIRDGFWYEPFEFWRCEKGDRNCQCPPMCPTEEGHCKPIGTIAWQGGCKGKGRQRAPGLERDETRFAYNSHTNRLTIV